MTVPLRKNFSLLSAFNISEEQHYRKICFHDTKHESLMLLSIYTSPLDKCEPAIQLTHFMQLISFYIFQKHKKKQLSSDALGGTERDRRHEVD